MKKIFNLWMFVLLLCCTNKIFAQSVTPCLISKGVVSAGGCTPGSVPDVYDCIAGIERQIARSVLSEDLTSWNTPATCYGWVGSTGVYNESLIPPANTEVNCTLPYDKCNSNYCPNRYCDIIKSLVDMKASLIVRATNYWGEVGKMQSGTDYYNAARQLTIDINAAFDCAGLKRPVIQGCIMEYCESSVNGIKIPAATINAFRYETGFDNSYYLDGSGNAKTTLKFNLSRIVNSASIDVPNSPDITKIEAKMLFYYLASLYIDLGYKSIHMGQMNHWANTDYTLAHSTVILNKIRQYAASKGTFVLLTEENFKARKFPGTDIFMFDYDSRALRPREVSSPVVCGDFNCNTPLNNYLSGTPCGSEIYPAVIDQCVINSAGNTSGTSPLNNCSIPFQPYNTYFDFGGGDFSDTGTASSGCIPKDGTWGWEDTKWFGMKISQACRKFWMEDAICRLRTYHNGFGFMAAPGILGMAMPYQGDNYLSGINPTRSSRRYLLIDEAVVKNAIISKWVPNSAATINISRSCFTTPQYCPGNPNKRLEISGFLLTVANPDCSTVYTWHIQQSDGTWLPFTYGTSRLFYPPVSGSYTIYLRQDNLGGFTGSPYFEVKTDVYYTTNWTKDCCGLQRPENTNQSDEIKIIALDNPDLGEFERYSKYKSYFSEEHQLNKTEEIPQLPSINIYPNPSDQTISIQADDISGSFQATIIDMLGRQLIKKEVAISASPLPFDISSLVPGNYSILLVNSRTSETYHVKFVKK